jgi:phage gp36-like protein
VAYCTQSQLEALLPSAFLTEALDDDRDDAADAGLLDEIIAAADNEVDAALGQRFSVPFAEPPPVAVHASKVFVLETLYRRRGSSDDNNPWAAQAAAVRKRLVDIGRGEAPLTPDVAPTRPPVSVITSPSKLHDPAGRILS